MRPGVPPVQSPRLLEQVRERNCYLHYSYNTEKTYFYWVRFFMRWSAAQPGGMRHRRDMDVHDGQRAQGIGLHTQPGDKRSLVFVSGGAEHQLTLAHQYRQTPSNKSHLDCFKQT